MFKRKKYDLAKFEFPHIEAIVARPRLYEKFDTEKNKRIIWLAAPAGSGKTSLIASYLSARGKKLIWYQVDAGDADVASFFHHMGLCIKKNYPEKRCMLPNFTSEYLFGLESFSINYFRRLFHKLESGSVLVLDNYQEAGKDKDIPLHEVIQAAANEIPAAIQLIIISRDEPPGVMARLRASEKFTLLDLAEIKFNRLESDDVAAERGDVSLNPNQLQKLYHLTQGWAAGLILTLEHLKIDSGFLSHFNFQDQSALFDYLAHEIFNDFDKIIQQILLKTAFLQRVSVSVADKLTNEAKTKNILNDLSQHQLLTIKYSHVDDSFEYHPLFREFLIKRAIENYSAQELEVLQNKTAKLELDAGNISAAAHQYIKIENWSELSALIQSHAAYLTQQGLHLTVEKWLNSIPHYFIIQYPWLVYWQAYCRVQYEPVQARDSLVVALELFKQNNDARGVYLCWCHLVESYVHNFDDFVPLVDLIKQYEALQKKFPNIPGMEVKARVTIGMFGAMVYSWPDHPDFEKWFKKAKNLFRFLPIKPVRCIIGATLSMYYNMKGSLHQLHLINDVMHTILKTEDISPLFKLFAFLNIGYQYMLSGDCDALDAVSNQAIAFGNQSGVTVLNRVLQLHVAYGCLVKGDAKSVCAILEELQDSSLSQTDVFYGYLLFFRARTDILVGDYISAYNNSKASLEVSYAGFLFPEAFGKAVMGLSLALQGDLDAGLKEVIAARESTAFFDSPLFDFSIYAYVSWIYLLKGDEQYANEYLTKSFSSAANVQIYSNPLWYGPLMKDLSLRALEQNIEPIFTRELICRNQLAPPDSHPFVENWPWPLKIYTLGRFSILLNEKPIDTESRPFDLLKILLAYGGRDVHEEKIVDALWPDAEGDQAQASFKTTLHRLRKVLGDLDVLVLKNHQLSLNGDYVWVDVWAMSRLFEPAQQSINTKDTAQSAELADKLMQRYRGHFLASEPASWAIHQREGLRLRFIRYTITLAQSIEHEDSQTAIQCYQRLLEIDLLIEEAYQGLIRCYQAQGRQAEALASYEKCVNILASTSGSSPSSATTDLIQS